MSSLLPMWSLLSQKAMQWQCKCDKHEKGKNLCEWSKWCMSAMCNWLPNQWQLRPKCFYFVTLPTCSTNVTFGKYDCETKMHSEAFYAIIPNSIAILLHSQLVLSSSFLQKSQLMFKLLGSSTSHQWEDSSSIVYLDLRFNIFLPFYSNIYTHILVGYYRDNAPVFLWSLLLHFTWMPCPKVNSNLVWKHQRHEQNMNNEWVPLFLWFLFDCLNISCRTNV